MEPPSSINTDNGKQASQLSDDPLSCIFTDDTLFIVMNSGDDESHGCFYVCASSAHTGCWYLGAMDKMES